MLSFTKHTPLTFLVYLLQTRPSLLCVLSHVAGKPHYYHITQLLEPLSGVLITSLPAEEAEVLRGLYPGSLCAIKDFCYVPPCSSTGPLFRGACWISL